jgi:hypothetical protein
VDAAIERSEPLVRMARAELDKVMSIPT